MRYAASSVRSFLYHSIRVPFKTKLIVPALVRHLAHPRLFSHGEQRLGLRPSVGREFSSTHEFATAEDASNFAYVMQFLRRLPDNFRIISAACKPILRHITHQHLTVYRNTDWDSHWKPISELGYDIVDNCIMELGNREMEILFGYYASQIPI